jgi:multiple sugar transport system permease protein
MKSFKTPSLVLTSPWSLTFLFFWVFPVAYSLYVSFTDYRLLTGDYEWIGLANYRELFADPAFASALKNTFIFVGGTIPFTTLLALGMALLVNRHFRGRALFRSAFFLPSITSLVVVALIFTNLYARGGYVATLANLVGFAVPPHGFLYDSSTALYSIMAMDIWMSVGYYMLIFLAGLKAIPDELYEAAEINGASPLRTFWSITLPLLRPVALFVEIFVMTKGKFDTATSVFFIYEEGLTTGFRIGYASAAAYVLFLVMALFSVAQFALLRRRSAAW